MLTRRDFLAQTAAGLALAGLGARGLSASEWTATGRVAGGTSGTAITVYKSPTCGCCAKWVDHLRANGFTPTVHDEDDMDKMKDEMGVPKAVRSCHTALLGSYLIEGHVPASDLDRLIAQRPDVAGLAVPGMPGGTPGMAEPGAPADPYDVLSFGKDGKTAIFAHH
ncbi:MAG: DUF411 domain-containing protein [Gemmatimonadales bacterium]|jgi:hypothetical protein